MSQAVKKVLFIGAGTVGKPILNHLVKAGFDLTVLSRSTSTNTFPSDVKVVKKDYTDPTLHEAFEGQDAVVSFVQVTALLDQLKFIDLAAKAGAKKFIPSEFGLDARNPVTHKVFFYEQKLTVLEHLKATSKAYPGFSWTGIATGPILDWCLKVKFLGYDIEQKTAVIYDGGDTKLSATNIGTIARAVEAVLKKPEETADKYLFTRSVTASPNEILASLEKATGSKWTVTKASTADAEKDGFEKLGKGDFSGVVSLLARLMFGSDAGGNFENNPALANSLLGLPTETLDETVKAVVEGRLP